MSTILDYVMWRGDLPFSVAAFNEVDALILCQIGYLDFGGLISENFSDAVTLKTLAEKLKNDAAFERRVDLGAMINKLSSELFFAAAKSKRFSEIKACGYINHIDTKNVEQFAALTYLLDDENAVVVFRGTDDTIVGWYEDFNLGVLETVPAQADALLYLTEAFNSLSGKISVAGHSKGGNLSIYSSAFLEEKFRDRLVAVYNNDGPGFREDMIASPEFQNLIPKIRSFYPQFSIVGMLFSHAGDATAVESEESGIMQHDPFSWHVLPRTFVALEKLDTGSVIFHKTFNSWFSGLDEHKRKQFVDTLFMLVQATDARTNSEFEKNLLHNYAKIIHALINLDNETRSEVWKTLTLLFEAANKNLPDMSELFADTWKSHKVKLNC